MHGLDAAWFVALVAIANLVFLAFNEWRRREHDLRMRRFEAKMRIYLDYGIFMHHVGVIAHDAQTGRLQQGERLASREISDWQGRLKLAASPDVERQADAWALVVANRPASLEELAHAERAVLVAMRHDLDL